MNEEKPTRPCPVCKAPMEETLQDYIVAVEDGDDLVIELEIIDPSDPENIWKVFLTAPAK